jgi:hypothetical protein
MPQTTLEPPQPLLLPSRTVVDSSKVKLMPSMTTATPIHEAEADVSQPFPENLEFDLEIDDSYDCVKNERLDIPQEILSKISDQTKTRIDCSTILPLYHFKSNSLANVDQMLFHFVTSEAVERQVCTLRESGRSHYPRLVHFCCRLDVIRAAGNGQLESAHWRPIRLFCGLCNVLCW